MRSGQGFIFDLDGTIYRFKGPDGSGFASSMFYADLKQKIVDYIARKIAVDSDEAARIIGAVDREFQGELSIGFEKRFSIDRYEYYEQTWGRMEIDRYVAADPELAANMSQFTGRSVLLTAAPRVWADKVLVRLGLTDIFGERIISGEPDLRKPSPVVFRQARLLLGAEYGDITAIGDQNDTDIIPAKSLGMKTIIVSDRQQSADRKAKDIYEVLRLLEADTDEN